MSIDSSRLPIDLGESRRRLPAGTAEEQEQFALRQWSARRRLTLLLAFYRSHPCCMARTHLLAACAIVLGRFCGYSVAFDQIGEALMPLTPAGEPRTALWAAYTDACRAGRPQQMREELWLSAHMADLEQVRAAGIDALFYAEAEAHRSDPTWLLLRRHMEVTVGERVLDAAALSGMVAYESAMAQTMTRSLRLLLTAGLRLLGRYAGEATRALILPAGEPRCALVGYRRCALLLIAYSITAWSASRIYRRGVRQRDRGRRAEEDGWPLLAQVLGDRVAEVHPLIVRFYRNPSPFRVRASLRLQTLPARLGARLATLLTGQGLYEEGHSEIEARFRVFRRADGSMHFLRELTCGAALRVFDSDFVVRFPAGVPTLAEVFPDLNLIVEMETTPGTDGALMIRGRRVLWHGMPLPTFGIVIEFVSRVFTSSDGDETLQIEGAFQMKPCTKLGRFIAYRLLRRPETLGSITYLAHPID